MTHLALFGKLLGSELQPSFRSTRQVRIGVCDDDDAATSEATTFSVERSMSPFKFYHDLCAKMSTFTYAYGPCWEGCMAQLNLSLDKLVHPARDPSRPMPWWDKSRLYLRGRLTCAAKQAQVIYHLHYPLYTMGILHHYPLVGGVLRPSYMPCIPGMVIIITIAVIP